MPAGSGMQQTGMRSVKEQMKRLFYLFIQAFCFILMLAACSPRIYRPPALGAEYQFDRGLPRAKHPSTLFGKEMNKDLEEKGIIQKSSPGSSGVPVRAAKTDSSASHPTTVSNSAKTDSLTTPAPVMSPASPDSSHNGPD